MAVTNASTEAHGLSAGSVSMGSPVVASPALHPVRPAGVVINWPVTTGPVLRSRARGAATMTTGPPHFAARAAR